MNEEEERKKRIEEKEKRKQKKKPVASANGIVTKSHSHGKPSLYHSMMHEPPPLRRKRGIEGVCLLRTKRCLTTASNTSNTR
jgi:hypothetical protein